MANITHELKTPLIPIKGYSELLFEGHLGSLDEDQKKGIGVILQNAERLHKLIDSLLYMQNIRSGNIQYHLDSINIVNVLDNVIDELLVFKDKELPEMKKEYSFPLPFICGNTTYLEQVFSHILENALKFTPSDGLITVVASHEDKNIRIIVRDTGIGISQEEMPNIFKRFYQVDGSLTRRYGGNGLGLYLCKSVVEAHATHFILSSISPVPPQLLQEEPFFKKFAISFSESFIKSTDFDFPVPLHSGHLAVPVTL